MPKAVKVDNIALGVAERMDVVIDFSRWAGKTLYLENRLLQGDGRGPDANLGSPLSLAAPGAGNFLLQFRVRSDPVADHSMDYETNPGYQVYTLPPRPAPRVRRTFRFDRVNNIWTVNGKPFPDDASTVSFRVKQNSAEEWTFINKSGGWMHPIHVHFEEFQLIRRNGRAIQPGDFEYSRKDVMRMQHGEENVAAWRFRDFEGRYPMHCHNTIHEDHAMMLRWEIDQTGDTKAVP
jgi:FtsP/CotA-like multicopper oxidase with cupredoxin domain